MRCIKPRYRLMKRIGRQFLKMIRLFEEKSHVQAYSLHRPTWPKEVVITALKFLGEKKANNAGNLVLDSLPCSHMVDIGCGSGQSTPLYAAYCKNITALDPSKEQIKVAQKSSEFSNIKYMVGTGEAIPLADNSVELICCAQSVHWLNWDVFFKECRRVLVPHGCMATYGYALPNIDFPDQSTDINQRCNEIFLEFYKRCRFHQRRRHIDTKLSEFYEALPCEDKRRNDEMKIKRDWSLQQFRGYISTWSGYRKLEEECGTTEILPELIERLKEVSKHEGSDLENIRLHVTWDIFMILSSRPS